MSCSTTILDRIITRKRQEVSDRQDIEAIEALYERIQDQDAVRGFTERLVTQAQSKQSAVIAEIKRASPSKGLLRADFQPALHATQYEKAGATCLSVLTDQDFFQGSDADLKAARSACQLPVIRKDFMIDPLQIVESRALGADCILLIMAALNDALAAELESVAFDYGMDVLIECHDSAELARAAKLRSPLMGINNRNLKTMDISLDVGAAMLPHLPADRIAIAESGLFTPEDLAKMAKSGARCFLIGESLMRADDVAAATKAILANPITA